MTATLGEALRIAVAMMHQPDAEAPPVQPPRELFVEEHLEDETPRRVKLRPDRPAASSLHLGWPVQGRLSSPFGERVHPITGKVRLHAGVDIAAAHGTPIVVQAAGRVVYAGSQRGYGLTVMIDHGNGLMTLYGHMSEVLVGVGDRLDAGAVLGKVGRTGTATGDHVHFEVRRNGRPVDPISE